MSRRQSHKQKSGSKPPLTHFLCLPLVNDASRPQLEHSLRAFKEAVTSPDQETHAQPMRPVIHAKAVRPVGTLHCTLGVMSLKQDQISEATELLESIDMASLMREASTEVLSAQSKPSPLTVDLKGVESMHAAHKTSILYIAPADETERLYSVCLAIQKIFQDKGLLVPDDRKLKLHATVVNTIYAKGRKHPPKKAAKAEATTSPPLLSIAEQSAEADTADNKGEDRSQGHGPYANAALKFDASAILEQYRNHLWAKDVVLDRIAICEMGAKKITDSEGNVIDERYSEVESRSLLPA